MRRSFSFPLFDSTCCIIGKPPMSRCPSAAPNRFEVSRTMSRVPSLLSVGWLRLVAGVVLLLLIGAPSPGRGQQARTDRVDRLVLTDGRPVSVAQVYRQSHALLIGINRYKNRPRNLWLSYADNDVNELKQLLIDHYGFEPQNVVTLLNEQATFDVIRRKLAALSNPRLVEKEDRVLIFFAGHGQTLKLPTGDDMGFLIPYDADPLDPDHPDDPTPYQSSCLPMNFVWSQLQSSPAKHVLL